MFNNFRKLPKLVQRALIAGTFVVILVSGIIPKKEIPAIIISSTVVYWILIFLFSWVWAAKDEKGQKQRNIDPVQIVAIASIFVILSIVYVGNRLKIASDRENNTFGNEFKKAMSAQVDEKKNVRINTSDWIPSNSIPSAANPH
jgi:hypothetical protein